MIIRLILRGHAASMQPFAVIGRHFPMVRYCRAFPGIRPKTTAAGQSDFAIQRPEDTDHRGYIALYGIESPGLTASLAIGEHVAQLAGVV